MYPLIRYVREVSRARRAAPLPPGGLHLSSHMCLPWDIDPYMELNNGRFLTLFDLGRVPLAIRTGLVGAVRREGWRLAIAGSNVRYRRQVRMWDRFEMRSRTLGRDARFFYIQQGMWRGEDCLASGLFRAVCADANGIVGTDRVLDAMGAPGWSPPLPGWVEAWIAAEAARPWPPET